jgi:hypothetical protein
MIESSIEPPVAATSQIPESLSWTSINKGEGMSFINQYSFLLIGFASLLFLGYFLFRNGIRAQDVIALAALVIGLTVAFFFLSPGESSSVEIQEVRDQIGGGTPVLLEMQSPY